MTQFKVGDRVRCDGRVGVVVEDDATPDWPLRVQEQDGSSFWIGRDGVDTALDCPAFMDVEGDELTALRAFKEQAIARYPDMAEPESDEDAARRFYNEWDDSSKSMLDEIIPAIMAWARANPR